MIALVKVPYDGLQVEFSEDGWFNATVAAEKFGKEPAQWMRLPETQAYLAALEASELAKKAEASKCVEITHLNSAAAKKSQYVKTRRGNSGGTWIHPRLAVAFARWLDVNFAVWCDDQIDGLLRGKHEHCDWKRMRHEATSSYKVMNAVLQLQRQYLGKPSQPYHYANEAKLINWALTGEFKSVNRDALEGPELDLLARLEERNTVAISFGMTYELRKQTLELFVANWKTVSLPRQSA